MGTFSITFFKQIQNSSGHPFKCPQEAISIRRAKNIARAIEAAKRRFERHRRIPYWNLHADTYELAIDGHPTGYIPNDDRETCGRMLRCIPGAKTIPQAGEDETFETRRLGAR